MVGLKIQSLNVVPQVPRDVCSVPEAAAAAAAAAASGCRSLHNLAANSSACVAAAAPLHNVSLKPRGSYTRSAAPALAASSPKSTMQGQRRSAAGIVPQQLLQIEQEQYKQGRLSDTYVWPVHHRATLRHDEFSDMEIPVIDLSCLQTGDPTAMNALVSEIRAACLEWGFFQVINHGVPLELISRVQKQAVDFFSLPLEEKSKVAKGPGKSTGYGFATLSDKKPWSEGFYFADDPSVDDFSRTLWPQGNNPDFADSYREYDAGVKALALKLMHVIIAGLEVDDTTHFDQYLKKCSALFRWNYYPPCPEPEKTVGLTAHTDYSLLTVLHQGEIGGLQVEKDGQWIAIRPREGAFAINVGDTLQALTNGKYKSVPHRAVVNRSDTRISLAYFFAPTKSIPIYPHPELVQAHETGAPLYRPFTFEEFTSAKIVQALGTLDRFQLSLR